jgi:hypothetical protein
MDAAAIPGEIGRTLEVLESAMSDLAGAEFLQLPPEVAGSAFTAQRAWSDDAVKGFPRWLMIRTKITKAAANAVKAWSRRFEEHPLIIAALAERDVISESWARTVTGWTGKLPEEHVQEADQIMVAAAKAGADIEGLARIAAELLALLAPPDTDPETGPDRSLRLETTFDGAAILHGDLSPRCAAVVKTVLDALAVRNDSGDTRSPGERYHDALEDAMTRLLAAGTLPPRRGKPLTALVHINLADLIARDRDSVLEQAWIKGTAAPVGRRTGRRAHPDR